MDFQTISYSLPYPTKDWDSDNVSEWLKLIDLPNLIPQFKSKGIDGRTIFSLTKDQLANQFKISSFIIIRKIRKWIEIGLPGYDEYIQDHPKYRHKKNLEEEEQTFQRQSYKDTLCKYKMKYNHEENKSLIEQNCDIKPHEELFLCSEEMRSKKKIHVTRESRSGIGRNMSNKIIFTELEVSRFHAEILFENQRFYLRDNDSCEGTFFKINGPVELSVGSCLLLGSTVICVREIKEGEITLWYGKSASMTEQQKVSFGEHRSHDIGRNPNNSVVVRNDHQLSNFHGVIYRGSDMKHYYRDLITPNGSWKMLQGKEPREKKPIYDGMIVKFASYDFRFQFIQSQSIKPYLTDKNMCVICCVNLRNCYIEPCYHHSTCLSCLKNVPSCPICRVPKTNYFKLYQY